jgi:alpha-amylase
MMNPKYAASSKFQFFFIQMQIRKCQDIHSRSSVKILEARPDLYSAIIDERLCMKIGEGSWCPSDPEWRLAASGDKYAVWHK